MKDKDKDKAKARARAKTKNKKGCNKGYGNCNKGCNKQTCEFDDRCYACVCECRGCKRNGALGCCGSYNLSPSSLYAKIQLCDSFKMWEASWTRCNCKCNFNYRK